MRIFTFNGPKAAYNMFAGVCVLTIVYFGFIHGNSAVEVSGAPVETTYLAVIVDGFGDASDGVKEFMYMDIPFTGAVLPGCSRTAEDARLLVNNGKEVIAHIPMEPDKKSKTWVPDGAVLLSSGTDEAKELTLAAMSNVAGSTGAIGGYESKVMEDKDIGAEISKAVTGTGLYFIDSAKPGKSGNQADLPSYFVDIVLDGEKDSKKIEKNIKKAGEMAVKNGYAVALMHVGQKGGKTSAQALIDQLPELSEKGVKLVTMTELIEKLNNQAEKK